MTGSMLIPNSLGTKTLLVLTDSILTGNYTLPTDALDDARAALRKEKACPTVREGNVKFLTEWVRVSSLREEVQEEIQVFQQEIDKLVKED
jgi:hypothetical protein